MLDIGLFFFSLVLVILENCSPTFLLYTDRYRGEMEKGKRADIYLEVWKRRGHTYF
jgi:hypothetical protein